MADTLVKEESLTPEIALANVNSNLPENNLFEALKAIADICICEKADISSKADVTLGMGPNGHTRISSGAVVEAGVRVESGAKVGRNARAEFNSRIGEGAVVNEGAVVGIGANVFERVTVSRRAKVGSFAVIKTGAVIDRGGVIGASAVVDERLFVDGTLGAHCSIRRRDPNIPKRQGWKIGEEATFAVGACLGYGAEMYERSEVGAGTVIGQDSLVYWDASVGPASIIDSGLEIRGPVGALTIVKRLESLE